MRLPKAKLILFLLLTTPYAFAAEEGAEGAKPAAETENKDQKAFSEKNAKLNTLASKIEEADKHFETLVKDKNEAKDSAEKQRLIKEMTEVDNERNKAKLDYAKLKSEIQLRFPNQGVSSKRNYSLEGAKPQKEQKGAATLDDLLTRTKKIIDKKFAATADEKKIEADAQKAKEQAEPEKRLRLEK